MYKKYNILNRGDVPESEEDRKAYLREKNKFLSARVERMFIPEYYELRNELSISALTALDDINFEIKKFRDRFIDKNTGKLDTSSMSEVQFARLATLQQLKSDFENQFEDFELFWFSKEMTKLQDCGILLSF